MEVSPSRLPRLLMVLVLAFAPYEPRPMLAAAEMFRGMAIQLSYRWAAGRVLAEPSDRAVLLWSDCGRKTARDVPREALSVLVSVVTGIVLFLFSNLLLLVALSAALSSLGVSAGTVSNARFAVVALRLTVTFFRAVHAYRHDSRLMAKLPQPTGVRWRVDLLAASPEGSGHGRELLRRFLERADEADAELLLNCDSRNVTFYRHYGFVLAAERASDTQFLMRRPARTDRRIAAREAQRAAMQGHRRRHGTT